MNIKYRISILVLLVSFSILISACSNTSDANQQQLSDNAIERDFGDCLIEKSIEFRKYAQKNKVFREYRYVLSSHYAEVVCKHIIEQQ